MTSGNGQFFARRLPTLLGALCIAGGLVMAGSAEADNRLPDRADLSYSENVTINIACAAADHQGKSQYDSCVVQQLRELKTHPTPDRSGLSADRNRTIEDRCSDYRRSGLGDYNDCLVKAMAAPKVNSEVSPNEELAPSLAKVFTSSKDAKSPPTQVAMASMPLPRTALSKRPQPIHAASMSPSELFKRVERSVFVVLAAGSIADARARDIKQGSAVAVTDHLLLTNCHVVKDRPLIKIVQNQTVTAAKLVAADSKADRCVLQADGIKLTPVAGVRPFDSLQVGERVFAIGAPRGFDRTLSEGLISGLRRTSLRNLIQTSAAVSPGSSGGGLFDDQGNLIGITTLAVLYGAQNLNFAVAAADFWD